ncbi:MAG: bifunctional adenosylcobinamide kinase/adenosylcobinamide-phosphate guanylyltransferase [Thalassotalea sp.]
MQNIHLILGGARSGKSSFAEQTALASNKNLVYIATASADDKEMAKRILHHQTNRGGQWQLVECKYSLADSLRQHVKTDTCVLVDCLTLWLTNCLCQHGIEFFLQEKNSLLKLLPQLAGQVIFVSNEVGHGIVPLGELSRDFVDHAGWLHQEIAALASQVDFVIAGLPLSMKAAAGENKE